MTTFATFAFVFLALCTPALADAPRPPRPDVMKVHFSLKDGSAVQDYDVIVSSDGRCATAGQKRQDREVEITACASHDAHLALDWHVRSTGGEYRSTSSIPFEHGSTAELGSTTGPRLIVTIE
ncbi:MAG: hypothetical protein E6J90_07335 [Deltaproteobacteria bacterium]|nr:MAG: hypothetical protein E6J90_07335 [Deltaproteobacteria bacterium]